MTSRRTTTVLWPSDIPPTPVGICYGWTKPLLLVAGVVPAGDGQEEQVNELIASAIALPQWHAVRDMFSSQPTVIAFGEAAPLLSPEDYRIVLYRRHRRHTMRFYAFDFNELDILPLQDSAHDPSPSSVKNAEAALQADFTRTQPAASRKGGSLDAEVLSQANFAQLLADLVECQRQHRGVQPPAPSTPLVSTPERPTTPNIPPATDTNERSSYAFLRHAASELHAISRELSTTADQLDVRFEQGIYVAGELPHVYHDKARTVTSISKYIKFHNCVWLVLNDVIIGVAFGSFLCENRQILAAWLDYVLQHYLVHRMELALLWLNNWPAGLKLNTELSQFYCHSLIGVVSAWGCTSKLPCASTDPHSHGRIQGFWCEQRRTSQRS
ncbi:hypothetical protein NUW54_g11898 [Trametes sanguinea]|uniref:Uncharacterized protein n=1 Tax=Trametes sanguinea TaxID=158606 RepID=A0ACC1N5Z0_9APHY|nr:hypothetical protein NUW54_g11898 [Trametes sanguinea]